jgi:signal transduction histidine kinase
LATLPVRLIPGQVAGVAAVVGTPLELPLLVAWCCVVLAAAAVAVLVAGAMSLSERRGAFVSAVTHELRTPLTTFRMYAEMLSEDMVAGEDRKREYLKTLSAEGNRLSHLVENVLSYARLERGRAGGHVETVLLDAAVDRVRGRLGQRAEQAGMSLVVDCGSQPNLEVRADLSVVEQILFNLVDNACKYAGEASDPRIHLETGVRNGSAIIAVRDHGPGIVAKDARRLFRPFCKSAKHAAETAPGVGLGLALSRRLARQMGGDLVVSTAGTGGATFELVLPAES